MSNELKARISKEAEEKYPTWPGITDMQQMVIEAKLAAHIEAVTPYAERVEELSADLVEQDKRFTVYFAAIIVLTLLFLAASGERATSKVDTAKLPKIRSTSVYQLGAINNPATSSIKSVDTVKNPYDSTVDFRFALFKADSTFSYRFGISDGRLVPLYNPCNNPAFNFTALTYTACCKDNPFHCQVCGHPFEVADALVLYVTSVEGQTTTAQYAHYICTLKPKNK